jgi:hypothetical protein
VENKQQRNTFERYVEAMEDADELLECYRRIQRHLARLAVSKIPRDVGGHATENFEAECEHEHMEDRR